MDMYKVGQVIEKFINRQEGVHFDLSDDGATMIVFFNSPTEDEISQFKSDVNFEIRFNVMYDIIMITARIGNLKWMDAPYTPHLSKNLTKFEMPSEDKGLALTLLLVDAATGEIKSIRLLGLSEKFTRRLFGAVMEEKLKDFDIVKYHDSLGKAFTYNTKQIVSMSKDYCRIN